MAVIPYPVFIKYLCSDFGWKQNFPQDLLNIFAIKIIFIEALNLLDSRSLTFPKSQKKLIKVNNELKIDLFSVTIIWRCDLIYVVGMLIPTMILIYLSTYILISLVDLSIQVMLHK